MSWSSYFQEGDAFVYGTDECNCAGSLAGYGCHEYTCGKDFVGWNPLANHANIKDDGPDILFTNLWDMSDIDREMINDGRVA